MLTLSTPASAGSLTPNKAASTAGSSERRSRSRGRSREWLGRRESALKKGLYGISCQLDFCR